MIYSTAAGPGFELDTMVTYSCEGGFSLVGGDEMRTCGGVSSSSEGVWSGNEPSCQGICSMYNDTPILAVCEHVLLWLYIE